MDVEQALIDKEVKYITQGADYLIKCLNPEHPDSHPSMRVDRITGIFHCFSCGDKGNIFERFGHEVSKIDKRTLSLKQKIMSMQKPAIYELPEDAKLFNRKLRGISKETYNKFEAFTTCVKCQIHYLAFDYEYRSCCGSTVSVATTLHQGEEHFGNTKHAHMHTCTHAHIQKARFYSLP